jgi:GAF domain-containing protein
MAEVLHIPEDSSKEELYKAIIPQIRSLTESESSLVANLANIAAVLNTAFDHLWTGFYLLEGDSLVLGPFQGPIACTRIPVNPIARGVCGAAAKAQETQLVADVDKFEGHIACSSEAKSEIVVPLIGADGQTKLVLDIDSASLGSFDETDQIYCEEILSIIKALHFSG